MKISPTPWSLQPCQASHGETSVIADAKGMILARIPSAAWDDRLTLRGNAKHDKANAALITSAPEMLKALQRITQMLNDDHEACHLCDREEGEGHDPEAACGEAIAAIELASPHEFQRRVRDTAYALAMKRGE